MKVKVRVITEEKFEPVEIRLEDKEAFDALWHMMNNALGKSLKDYIKEKGLCPATIGEAQHQLWALLSHIGRPDNE